MLTLWIASVLARSIQLLGAFRLRPLLCFAAFLQMSAAEEIGYMMLSSNWIDFTPIQAGVSPYLAGLRVLAAVEAFWWLASALPRFRKPGAILMLICAALAWWASRGVHSVGAIQHLEVATAFGLVSFLGATMLIHAVIGTEAESAMWHAGLFGLAALANGGGWYFQSSPSIGMWVMFGGQILAAGLWLWKVRTPPTWREPEPTVTAEEARESIENLRKAAGR